MAGDWIKMRTNLWDDPRVSKLCDITNQTEAAIVGGLYWLWATADEHTECGTLHGMTTRAIDRKTGIAGLGQGLVDIGWLADHPEGVRIVGFDEHNGTSAKKRCQTAKRVEKHKTGNAPVTQQALADNAPSVSDALPREEKRREEEKQDQKPAAADAAPKPKRKTKSALPSPFLLSTDMAKWARERAPRADLNLETEKFCNHWRAKGETRADWHATWRNWMLNAQQFAGRRQLPIAEPDFEDTSWANDLGPL